MMAATTESAMRIALYARVSTSEQAEGLSLDAQLRALRLHAAEHGHDAGAAVPGWTGALARDGLLATDDPSTRGCLPGRNEYIIGRSLSYGVLWRCLKNGTQRILTRGGPGV